MADETIRGDGLSEVLERRERRRSSRRDFLRFSGLAAGGVAGAAVLSACDSGGPDDPAPTPPPPAPAPNFGEGDVLNFALTLEYLEAQFYSYAVNGTGLPPQFLGGVGTGGGVTGGRQVNFTDPVVRDYAREIAREEEQHVSFLKSALGALAVAQPAIDIRGGAANTPFGAAAAAAGLPATFDPYASDEDFLLGAYIFEDVGVTAYKGAAPLINNKVFLEAAAGILAAEAYHAAIIRTTLFGKGVATPALRDATVAISNARDSLDGSSDVDQGVIGTADASNIAPLDANGIAFSRSPGQVLNIAYLTKTATDRGGFFPSGINGFFKQSAAS